MTPIVVPAVGESISEVQISQWLKKEGEWVSAGTDLVDLETEKASVQISAPADGYLVKILKPNDQFAAVGEAIAEFQPAPKSASNTPASTPSTPSTTNTTSAAPVASSPASTDVRVMPAARRMAEDNKLSAESIPGTGPGGRVLKEDVANAVALRNTPTAPAIAPALTPSISPTAPSTALQQGSPHRSEEVKPMSMIRRTIATRLVRAQHEAALLTTFNEVDMQPVMQLRNKYKDAFLEKHGTKLGFMSFFAKAACEALKRFPAVNAEIRGNNIVYRHYYDIGIAIGGGKGLVVPILRNVERMSFADVERNIGDFAELAKNNRLMPEDLEGGTFTISNGGVYGSLLSTPIVNPPQSGILGLHSIQERPVALNGQVVIRPMMYLALTYDHRIIDGREAVTFLKTIKDVIEDPARLFLEL
ncbi:MAG: 2-oxoglutarate dehydrogenase complex dihydrolipoyllysine-residue succinyltransferase [Planctomycetaceae bacterium]|jgi:2-oxoglutarate dehydrogenase E2 component (dihydrolipoamide succinyltransferase)|nr:2-oxoglutarate dehydrogenase complex dihydrolipoyllysine-residue succinyltransferase [Planctomycetaceae bacterium]